MGTTNGASSPGEAMPLPPAALAPLTAAEVAKGEAIYERLMSQRFQSPEWRSTYDALRGWLGNNGPAIFTAIRAGLGLPVRGEPFPRQKFDMKAEPTGARPDTAPQPALPAFTAAEQRALDRAGDGSSTFPRKETA